VPTQSLGGYACCTRAHKWVEDKFCVGGGDDPLDQLHRTDAERANSGSLEISVVDLTNMGIELFELANEDEQVVTTSYVDTKSFWQTPSAVPYLLTNKALIRDRNVGITRIFIFDDEESLLESEEEMDKQLALSGPTDSWTASSIGRLLDLYLGGTAQADPSGPAAS
jgi:hypothetical protein